MNTEWCMGCGLLWDPEVDDQCDGCRMITKIKSLEAENKKLKEWKEEILYYTPKAGHPDHGARGEIKKLKAGFLEAVDGLEFYIKWGKLVLHREDLMRIDTVLACEKARTILSNHKDLIAEVKNEKV